MVAGFFSRVAEHWADFWGIKEHRREFLISFLILLAVMLTTLKYLHFNEMRHGVRIADPLLSMIPPQDLSNLTFFLLYLGLLCTVIMLMPHPKRLVIGMQAYALYAAIRMLAMWLIPLLPPEGMIELRDPVLSWLHTGKVLERDLFFSGHTATMFIFYLVLPTGRVKTIYLWGFLTMAACLIVQRVHYSIDVLSAPFYSYGAYAFVLRVRRYFHAESQLP